MFDYREVGRELGPQYAKGANLMNQLGAILLGINELPKKSPKEKTTPEGLDSRLALSVFQYNTEQPRSGELIRQTWEDVLRYAMKKADIDFNIEVPEVGDATLKDLDQTIEDRRSWNISPMGLLFPPEFEGKRGREEILIPALKAVGMKGSYVNPSLNEIEEQTGYLTTEDMLESPNLDSMPKQLDEFFAKQERKMIGLNQYLTLALFLKVTTGHFPDENTVTFLANRSSDGGVGRADFRRGELYVRTDLNPGRRGSRWGARSVGVNKT